MSRTRLRSRVFAITATYALFLVGIAFILTWRARLSHNEFQGILEVDSKNIAQLEELQRTHNAFITYWSSVPEAEASRYSTVRQILEKPPLAAENMPAVSEAVKAFDSALLQRSPEEVRRLDRAVGAAVASEIALRRKKADRRIRALARTATDSMWVALGVAYIVAILSFAVARLTLSKLVRPIENLSHAAERLAAEDFTVRARVEGDAEVAQLAESFNRMAGKLALSHDALRERARTDELTGLPNFRAFRETLSAELARAKRYKHRFGLLVFDIDHFKRYNDEFGHLGGNEALKAVADTIRQTLRAVDMAARYGGEEFVAVLPEIEPQGLATLAERIRLRVAALAPIQGDRRITISIGGAVFPQDGNTDEELFEAADSRLYEAKGSGRNRALVLSALSSQNPSRVKSSV